MTIEQTPAQSKNYSIWKDGEKPRVENVVVSDCTRYFGELWDALKVDYHGEEDFRPIKTNPTETG
jgi:hypothetical protein